MIKLSYYSNNNYFLERKTVYLLLIKTVVQAALNNQ